MENTTNTQNLNNSQGLNLKNILPEFFVIGGIVVLVIIMVIPIPAFLLDFFIALSISLSLTLLVTAMYVKNPLEFSIFPTLLLIATLFRLSLNVASTKRILLHGNEGTDAAGHIIKTFGAFVVGGNYTVGIIVFLILVIINFVVIVKGSERVSEVAARFTLDAMPGKQMSIDADLSSGLITEEEARKRREEIVKEADFYGAMDGATKFVKGDAIAGLVITFINILGGIAIGVLQQGMPISEALSTYTILTVGDGLASQIPSLLTSTATGIIITRAASEDNFGKEIVKNLTIYPRALMLVGGFLIFLGFVPGFPKLIFIVLGSAIIIVAYRIYKKQQEELKASMLLQEMEKEQEQHEEKDEDLIEEDILTLEIGYKLIPLVDEKTGAILIKRLKNLRQELVKELGILLPKIRIRDNLQLEPNEYVFYIRGIEEARGNIEPDRYLAVDVGMATRPLSGIPTKDPIFNLRAYWIPEELKKEAQRLGYTVIDAPTVIITHISEIIKNKAYEIITREDTQRMLDIISQKYPKIVEEALDKAGLGVIHRVLVELLKEKIPIKDIVGILETIADYAPTTKDIDTLTEIVRKTLRKVITNQIKKGNKVKALVLSPELEEKIRQLVSRSGGNPNVALPPTEIQRIIDNINTYMPQFMEEDLLPVVLVSPDIRKAVFNILSKYIPSIKVVAYDELADNVKVETLGVLG